VVVLMLGLLVWVNRASLLARAAAPSMPAVAPPPSPDRVIGVGRFARSRHGPAPPL
jgi:hypothetical protein